MEMLSRLPAFVSVSDVGVQRQQRAPVSPLHAGNAHSEIRPFPPRLIRLKPACTHTRPGRRSVKTSHRAISFIRPLRSNRNHDKPTVALRTKRDGGCRAGPSNSIGVCHAAHLHRALARTSHRSSPESSHDFVAPLDHTQATWRIGRTSGETPSNASMTPSMIRSRPWLRWAAD